MELDFTYSYDSKSYYSREKYRKILMNPELPVQKNCPEFHGYFTNYVQVLLEILTLYVNR